MYGLVRKFQFLKPTILAATLVVMLVALVPTSAQAHGPSNQDHSPSSPLNQVDSRFVDVNEGDSFVLSVKNVEIHEPTDNPDNFDLRWSTYPYNLNVHDFGYGYRANADDITAVNWERQVGTYEQTWVDKKISKTFYTTEDTWSEKREQFIVGFNPATGTISRWSTYYVVIVDDDGPGAWKTWVASIPGASREDSSDTDETQSPSFWRGDTILIKQEFTEDVTVSGDVNIGFQMGEDGNGERKSASYVSGSGTDKLSFEYTVLEGDLDRDGISINASDYGGSGSIVTEDGNKKVNSTYEGRDTDKRVGGQAFVQELTIDSAPASGDTYAAGEHIEVKARFDRDVTVDGAVYVTLRFGHQNADWASARYNRGSGTSTLVFRHTVKPGEYDPDGITVVGGTVAADGTQYGFGGSGSITFWDSETEEWYDVSPYYDRMETLSDHKIETIPLVTDFAITSTPPNGKHYRIGDAITITATYDQDVTATSPLSVPVTIGTGSHTNTWTANYSSDSGDNKLVFKYIVGANQRDDDGITVAGSAKILDDGSITSATNPTVADRTVTTLLNQAEHKVYAYYPLVQSISVTSTPADGETYRAGETIDVTLSFQYEVDVADTPSIKILVGDEDNERNAAYSSGSGAEDVVFSYVVQPEDLDADGVAVKERSSGGLDGTGSIKEKDTDNSFAGAIPALADQADHKVDGRPYVTAASFTSSPASNAVYRSGESIQVTLTFSESMEVDGDVTIPMTVGDAEVEASYLSGSGTDTLVFGYAVQDTDQDSDGVSLPAKDSDAFGGTGAIQSADGEVAPDGTMSAVEAGDDQKVYGLVHVVSLWVDSEPEDDNTYGNGDAIKVAAQFDDDVTVTGAPQLQLDLGSEARVASFHTARSAAVDDTSSSDSESLSSTGQVLVFTYTVQAGDEDTDGISVTGNSLSLNDGTITFHNGKNADLAHEAVTDEDHLVDAVAPVLASASTSDDGSEVVVTFSEDVHIRSDLRTLFAFAGIDTGIYLRSLMDIFVDGNRPHIMDASVSGAELTLTMDTPITSGQSVSVHYDNIFANEVQGLLVDPAGNVLSEFSDETVTNNSTLDDDPDAIWTVEGSHIVTVGEGESNTLTFTLSSQPDDDVTISLSVSSEDYLSISATEVTFTTDNWDTAQTITVTANADDDEINGWHEILQSSDADGFVPSQIMVLVEE